MLPAPSQCPRPVRAGRWRTGSPRWARRQTSILRRGKLGEGHAEGLVEAGEGLDVAVALITPDATAEAMQTGRWAMSCEKTKLPVYIGLNSLVVDRSHSIAGRRCRVQVDGRCKMTVY